MEDKKYPGKFTVRFNIADPQQRAAAELLNQQGRCKAQFLTNAVLFYVHTSLDERAPFSPDSTMGQRMIMEPPSERREAPSTQGQDRLEDTELDSIRKTMEAFQSK